jgi:hypothetical protein
MNPLRSSGPTLRIAVAILAAAALACGSFAQSSESSSDSSNQSSKSSSDVSTSPSRSSSPDHDDDHDHDDAQQKGSFDQDVEQDTAAFVGAGGTAHESFLSGLGDLARQHSVSDWESQPATWEAIGRGLARSHASTAERTAYQAAWTGGDPTKQSAVAKGIAAPQ